MGLGFRVPLIVVSPYAKRGHVSHIQDEEASIPKFIENNFGLAPLAAADARADALADCFDYRQAPLRFQPVTPSMSARQAMRFELSGPPDSDY
jgi:phospholipase C